MSILKVANLGNPILREKTPLITQAELKHPDVQRLIDDMVDTMRDYKGVGLAAPQVHAGLRIFVAEVRELNPRYPEAEEFQLLVVINPVLQFLTDETLLGWEGCLSIPGLRGQVPRYTKLQLDGWDRLGKPLSLELSGFPAIVVQHETDHLNGIVYPDRMEDLQTLTFDREYDLFWDEDEESDDEDLTAELDELA